MHYPTIRPEISQFFGTEYQDTIRHTGFVSKDDEDEDDIK